LLWPLLLLGDVSGADSPRVTLRVTLTQGANITPSSVDVDDVEILEEIVQA